jgi:hypothetical protein
MWATLLQSHLCARAQICALGGLAGVIATMLRALARRYRAEWTPRTFAQFSSAVGGGALAWWTLRYGLREMLKRARQPSPIEKIRARHGRRRGEFWVINTGA